MGRGIVDRFGDNPSQKFKIALALLTPAKLQDAVRELIGGERVETREGSIDIVWTPNDTGGELTIRGLGGSAKVTVQPISRNDLFNVKDPDPKGAPTAPRDWEQRRSGGGATWELYNCRITSVDPAEP